MAPFGWKFGPRWGQYYAEQELDRSDIEKDAKALLARAIKGEAWTNPRGIRHIPLLDGSNLVGHLWEDADLASLEVGTYWAGRFGVKVELVHGSRVVGMLWLPQ